MGIHECLYIEPRFPVKPAGAGLVADIADALAAITLAGNCSPSLGRDEFAASKVSNLHCELMPPTISSTSAHFLHFDRSGCINTGADFLIDIIWGLSNNPALFFLGASHDAAFINI